MNSAGARLVEAAQTIEERSFAGPVWADQSVDLPGLSIKRNIAEGDDSAEAHQQPSNAKQWCTPLRHHGCLRRVGLPTRGDHLVSYHWACRCHGTSEREIFFAFPVEECTYQGPTSILI